jgi:poly(hydroxyalkanoate) depolymerase family esterase
MSNPLKTLMAEATRLTRSGLLGEATKLIQRALNPRAEAPRPPPPTSAAQPAPAPRTVLADAKEVAPEIEPASAKVAHVDDAAPVVVEPKPPQGEEAFIEGTQTVAGQTRTYKLYVPPGHIGQSLPLVVMLHGCTQDPDDFAAGTGMNELARERGFFVLYPAQSRGANMQRCWNWFKTDDQQRGGGEPAVIAAMARAVIKQYGIDARRVYVAGLSAGGAMAAIVAAAYPDLFAAAGVHSGLPRGAAHNVMEALAVMKSGDSAPGYPFEISRVGAARPEQDISSPPVPTIVFHGDLDHTVHPRNGEQVIAAVIGHIEDITTVEQGTAPHGHGYTRSIHQDGDGASVAEHWLVHGAGHAWFGGRAAGTYTDRKGPDASREMLRFFFEHPLRAAASPHAV